MKNKVAAVMGRYVKLAGAISTAPAVISAIEHKARSTAIPLMNAVGDYTTRAAKALSAAPAVISTIEHKASSAAIPLMNAVGDYTTLAAKALSAAPAVISAIEHKASSTAIPLMNAVGNYTTLAAKALSVAPAAIPIINYNSIRSATASKFVPVMKAFGDYTTREDGSTDYAAVAKAAAAVAIGAGVIVYTVPVVLNITGYTQTGITVGSPVASVMSALGGAFTPAHGIVSSGQIIGATSTVLGSPMATVAIPLMNAVGDYTTLAAEALSAAPGVIAAIDYNGIGSAAASKVAPMMEALGDYTTLEDGSTDYAAVAKVATAVAIGAGVAVYAAPMVVHAVGFTQGGIAAGSPAASMMSVLGGAFTPAGGIVATLQSVGATSTVLGSPTATGAAGTVGAAVGYFSYEGFK